MIRRLFRRDRSPAPLPEAELARRLVDPAHLSACAGLPLDARAGVVHPAAPFGWKNPPDPQDDDTFEMGYMEVLTENYARRDGTFMLRADLFLPVSGTEGHVTLGIWCSLSSGNHARFRSAQARGEADQLGELFSWLYTQLPPLSGPLLTKGTLVPQPGGQMPAYWITDEKHPFHAAQNNGMSAGEIVDLYEAFGATGMIQHLRG